MINDSMIHKKLPKDNCDHYIGIQERVRLEEFPEMYYSKS